MGIPKKKAVSGRRSGFAALPGGNGRPSPGVALGALVDAVSEEAGVGLCLLDASGRCVEACGRSARLLGLADARSLLGSVLGETLWPGEVLPPKSGARGGVRYGCRSLADGEAGSAGFVVTLGKDPEIVHLRPDDRFRRELDALSTLHEASGILSSTLEIEEIGTKLLRLMREVFGLTAAVIDTKDDRGRVSIWHSSGLDSLWPKARFDPVAEKARHGTLERGEIRFLELHHPDGGGAPVFALYVPLRVQEQVVGLLEAYGDRNLEAPGTVDIFSSLATQAASALENARLYRELSDREARLEVLVSRLLTAQEEERRRVAYEVHDGLAQTAAAAHHHLQAYARLRDGAEDPSGLLEDALELVRRTVGESRRVIGHLRPTTLDDFGLQTALRMEMEELRSEGWEVVFRCGLKDDERLSPDLETALFRIAQQAVNNVGKHAGTRSIRVALSRLGDAVRLTVRDRGGGFDPVAVLSPGAMRRAGAGSKVGVASMEERALLLGGRFRLLSKPGSGTLVCAEVPVGGGNVPASEGGSA